MTGWIIVARHPEHMPAAEIIDTADGEGEAWVLVYEYRVAYGNGWSIWPVKGEG